MKAWLKKYILLIALSIALAESLIMFYFYSRNTVPSVVFLMISYIILLFFPTGIFIASFKEFQTRTFLPSLENTTTETKHKKALEQFSYIKLQFYKKSFINKLHILSTLLEKNDFEAARKLLGEQVLPESPTPICNTNPIVNGILQQKKMECEKQGIIFEYSILFPEANRLSFSILISLFSNLLDNAIESCTTSPLPKIELSIDYKGDYLLIFMRNTKSSALSFDPDRKKTSKQDTHAHGFGLSIIEDIVKLHDGFCEWIDRKTYFESNIMLRYFP